MRIVVIVGTRPELLKMAPVIREARTRALDVHVHCTMQSPDLVDRKLLTWESEGPLSEAPWENARLVVVQGDTRTAFLGAVEAYERGIELFHVEAGVRSGDLSSPWPEEGYRRMISQVASYHACNTYEASLQVVYLSKAVRITGSPIVASVRQRAMTRLPNYQGGYVIVTLHRRENRGHFADILEGISEGAKGLNILWYGHPNGFAAQERPEPSFMFPQLLPPQDATTFALLLQYAQCVVTDSGGVTEEANALGVPCVITRTANDRPESIGAGGAILAGVTKAGVAQAMAQAVKMTVTKRDCYGDDTASQQIVDWWTEIVKPGELK